MGAAIRLRADFSANGLRSLASASRDAKQTRRLLALAVIYEGFSRCDAAKVGCVTVQIIRDSLPGSACLHAREGGGAL